MKRPGIRRQPRCHLADFPELLSALHHILDVLIHNLGHIEELVIEPIEVCFGPRVLKLAFLLLNYCVKCDESIRPRHLVELALVLLAEYFLEVFKKKKCQLWWVRLLSKHEVN